MTDRLKFNLHLPGLLKVLAEHLYTSKKVGIRELIQNAHDSCVRRKIEAGERHYRPRIDIRLDARRRVITIADNGNGLTEEEIGSYLSTIGRGYTRELREKLAFESPAEAAELIGQFGLGFLSAFLLASEVTLITRSVTGTPALRWQSSGDEHYDLEPAERDEVGTTVELAIKPAAAFILNEATLTETVRTYADFLPIPIHIDDDTVPINLMAPPWDEDDPARATLEYIHRVLHGMTPLCVFPLRDARVSIGHDSITVPLQGFLFVPPGSVASVREYGDLHVFIRRMFICERERDLLPPWARFVRGVVECPLLQPTASRESLHQDDNFDLVRRAIEAQLGEALRDLARDDVSTWRKVVRGHSDVIIGWAVSDKDFFDKVQDIVTFRTTRGPLNLPDYLDQSGGALYYVTRELGGDLDRHARKVLLDLEVDRAPLLDALGGAELISAMDEVDLRRKLGEEQSLFHCSIAASDDAHGLLLVEGTVARRTPRYSAAGELRLARDTELPRYSAGRKDDDVGLELLGIAREQEVAVIESRERVDGRERAQHRPHGPPPVWSSVRRARRR